VLPIPGAELKGIRKILRILPTDKSISQHS
jgi:hypothetical protein